MKISRSGVSIIKTGVLLTPVIVHLIFFVLFEPYNYFGLRDSSQYQTSAISRIREYNNMIDQGNAPNFVIFGDSRLAQIDITNAFEKDDYNIYNLSFGGASLDEEIDLFYYAYDKNPDLKYAVLGVSFYTLNEFHGTSNRIETLDTQLKNPFAFIYNLEYNINAFTNFMDFINGRPQGDSYETGNWTIEDYTDENGDILPYRINIINYAAIIFSSCSDYNVADVISEDLPFARMDFMRNASNSMINYAVSEERIQKIINLSRFCEDNNINLILVFPPMDISIVELVCVPLGIDTMVNEAISKLKQNDIRIINYEWSLNDYPVDFFYDGFHIDIKHGLDDFSKMFFRDIFS